jgi:hypothetical protein
MKTNTVADSQTMDLISVRKRVKIDNKVYFSHKKEIIL